ncbi:MAG: hypothetical protein K9K38_17030 [Rhodoferax sp.]|nr:hypothetical protein [Rhodoferax sp.]MCF8211082.1 hypothetical protein [Rhodoferax sp.]
MINTQASFAADQDFSADNIRNQRRQAKTKRSTGHAFRWEGKYVLGSDPQEGGEINPNKTEAITV